MCVLTGCADTRAQNTFQMKSIKGTSCGPGPSKQTTIAESLQNTSLRTQNRQEFVMDFVEMMVGANIPLEKADDPSMRAWLNKHIKDAGDLPKANMLRECYLPKLGQMNKDNIKACVKYQKIAIMCDETTDRAGRCIFVVLLKVLCFSSKQNVFVGAVKELQSATGAECSRAILSTVAEFCIQHENVVGIVTDSARYMTACVTTLKEIFAGNFFHVQCWAHKLNIVAHLWSSELGELNLCIQNTKHAFLNARKRKHRYVSFLKEQYPYEEKKPLLFPSPVMTRWNSWFLSAKYVCEYLEDLVEFFSHEEDGSSAVKFYNLSTDDVFVIRTCATFLVEHCTSTTSAITEFEGSSYALVHKVSITISDLQNKYLLVSRGCLGINTCSAIENLSSAVKKETVCQTIIGVALKCPSKLTSLTNQDPVKELFYNASQLFHHRNITNNCVDDDLYNTAKKIPVLAELSLQVFLEGYNLKP